MKHPNHSRNLHREDYIQALKSMDTFIDVTVDDLMALNERAEQFASRRATRSIGITRVMTQPVHTVHSNTPMTRAAHLMVTNRISGLPVVDDNECLTGIITEADFLRALGVPAHQPSHSLWQTLESMLHHLAHHGEPEAPDDPVSHHMAHNVICAHREQDVHDVLEIMKKHMVKRVVICDHQKKVRGMVTRSDLVRVFFDYYTQLRIP